MPTALPTSRVSSRLQLKLLNPLKSDLLLKPLATTGRLELSFRTSQVWDPSLLEPLESCTDMVTCSEYGKKTHVPRVLISRNARAYWNEGADFVFVQRSLSRCGIMCSVPQPCEVKAIFACIV